ncbi:DUF805 domain-containing protein [Listeria costaricensis]|uniref:DUF805 domain-containing protein n=1 Tax=Listeria costaricensis TaxID=2026604 RepID=UPI0013C45644|nr:DUF805 domain-containing protein [Listeria costaricensis]
MGFLEAYILYWKNYINFYGRSERKEFWYVLVWNVLIWGVLGGLCSVTGLPEIINKGVTFSQLMSQSGLLAMTLVVIWAFSLANFIPLISLVVRRLRDAGRTVWLVLLGFIPIIGHLIILVLMCFPSKKENY